MRVERTSYYLYHHTEDYVRKDSVDKSIIIDRDATEGWLSIRDGHITVHGSNRNGYSWDGCSPKFVFFDIILGTPDGVISLRTGKPKTYYASMMHDILYQFHDKVGPKIKRRHADRLFYLDMRETKFKWALFYYLVVRATGWIYWNRLTRRKRSEGTFA